MNLQKRALILTLSLVSLTTISYAGLKPAQAEKPATQGQQQSRKASDSARQQHPKENQARNGKENQLNLTDDQKAQIKQIQEETRQRISAVYTPEQKESIGKAKPHQRANLKLSAEQKAQIKAIQEDAKRQMQAILTTEQSQQLQGRRSSKDKHQHQQGSTKPASEKR